MNQRTTKQYLRDGIHFTVRIFLDKQEFFDDMLSKIDIRIIESDQIYHTFKSSQWFLIWALLTMYDGVGTHLLGYSFLQQSEKTLAQIRFDIFSTFFESAFKSLCNCTIIVVWTFACHSYVLSSKHEMMW